MIYIHSMAQAVWFHPERPALNVGEGQMTFRELDHRVASLAAALTRRGFRTGDRLALLLPNGPDYVELVYACSRVGIIITAEELIRHCRQSLANYKVPRHVEFSETDLPKSGSGKVLKRVSRERFWAGAERDVS